jgi:uncharacterized protein (DUF1015 family)
MAGCHPAIMAGRPRLSYDGGRVTPSVAVLHPSSWSPPEEPVPTIKPFRALRYEPETVGDLALVTSPPYDVILPDEHRALLARHPRNVVRLDLPTEEAGDGPDDRYRRAARTFAAWRSDGTFHRDPRPSLYVYEQDYVVPGTNVSRIQRGFLARLRLEPFGPDSGVLPHERTLSAPREDRYKLIRATGANTSPAVGLYEDASGRAAAILSQLAGGATAPAADITDGDQVRHRLWVVPADQAADEAAERAGQGTRSPAAELVALASPGPITIADGHHRYVTALRYRDERRMTRSCEEDPAFDYLLMLFLETTAEPLTVLPTHRVVTGLGLAATAGLPAAAAELFDVQPVADRASLSAAFGATAQMADQGTGRRGRFGLWTREGGAILTARRSAFERGLPEGGSALRHLDVTLLQVALDRLCGIDPGATAAGGRVRYTKSAAEAMDWVEHAADGAEWPDGADGADAMDGAPAGDAAFLVEGTPVADIVAVARDGDVMPQKSTYFFPKPLSGLVINPHEW